MERGEYRNICMTNEWEKANNEDGRSTKQKR